MEQKRYKNQISKPSSLCIHDVVLVVLISQDVGELQDIMEYLKMKSEKIGLTKNLSKTKIKNVAIRLGDHVIEKDEKYVYWEHIIK